MRTIEAALVAGANSSRRAIVLQAGTFALASTLSLSSDFEFVGGVDPTGVRICDPAQWPTVLSPEPVGLDISAGVLTFSQLTIRASASTATQPSSYGARISGGTVIFRDVRLEAAAGFNATQPMAPSPAGTASCDGVSDCSTGDSGRAGGNGAHATGGSFNGLGYLLGNGFSGGVGVAGENGVRGPSETSTMCGTCTSGTCSRASQGCGVGSLATITASGGPCGCRGQGGASGQGAPGGGASIGLLVSGLANVTFTRGQILTLQGGAGATGGAGGTGGTGSAGGAGLMQQCHENLTSCFRPVCSIACMPSNSPRTLVGGTGGRGGAGGSGGTGGSSAGGPSISIVRVGTTSSISTSNVGYTRGAGGVAGAGSVAGASQERLDVP